MSASTQTIDVPSESGIALTRDTPELASTYDQTCVPQFEHGKQLIARLNLSSGDCVLDIGAGTGQLAAYVGQIVGPSGWVVGMDPLPLRVEIARTKGGDNFEARVGQAEDLSQFADATFDVVYLNSVLHWVEDKPRAIAEMFRVLKSDGRLGLNCIDPTHPHEVFHFLGCALTEIGMGSVASLGLTGHELERLVTGADFVAYESELRSFVNFYPDVDALLARMSSSSFGNFLAYASKVERSHIRDAIGRLLEPKRLDGEGIRLERYLTFATARKPKTAASAAAEDTGA
jgi:arsenite methyltransferase